MSAKTIHRHNDRAARKATRRQHLSEERSEVGRLASAAAGIGHLVEFYDGRGWEVEQPPKKLGSLVDVRLHRERQWALSRELPTKGTAVGPKALILATVLIADGTTREIDHRHIRFLRGADRPNLARSDEQ